MATPAEAPPEPQYRVLLIGIDDYQKKPLDGCVNDIDRVQSLLLDEVGVPKDRICRLASPQPSAKHSTAVDGKPATLDNIRGELAALARDAQPGERIFIYYSGHGARAQFERGDGRTFHRESLVPFDVDRQAEPRLLADYELNSLLGQIALRTPSVTCVLDCCHSAGATRDPGLSRMRSRGLDLRNDLAWTRPLRMRDAMQLPIQKTRGDAKTAGTVDDCHVIAACLNHELAAETVNDDGVHHGVLTDAFVRALRGISRAELRSVPWMRIWSAICAAVKGRNPWQNPWMAGNPGRAVFAGPPVDHDPGVPIHRGSGAVYEIDAGTLASVTEDTRIAVYGETTRKFSPVGSPADTAERSGVLVVKTAGMSSATAAAEGAPFELPPGARGRIIEVGKPARLRCAIVPKNDGLVAALRDSPLISVVDVNEAQVRLEQVGDTWLVTDDKHESTVDTALVALQPADLPQVRAVLEHYYLYALPLRMAESAKDLPGELELRVLACPNDLSPEAAQEAELSDAGTEVSSGARVCFHVRNKSTEQLRVTLLNSAASGRVQLLGDQVIGPFSRHVFWLGGALGKPFVMTPPAGKRQCIDRLSAIGTTALAKDLSYLRVHRKFADILAITRGARDTTRDVGDDDDARNNPPVERWTAASAIVKTRAG